MKRNEEDGSSNLVVPTVYLGIEVDHVRRLTVALVIVDPGEMESR